MNLTATAMDTSDLLNEPVYLALQIDHLRLLVPQAQFAAMASAETLQPKRDNSQPGIGSISRGQQTWPVYALNNALELTTEPPSTRAQCVLLTTGTEHIGLLCDQAFPIERSELIVGPIPACMQSSELLFSGLAIYQDQIAFLSTADILYRQLQRAEH